MGLFLRTLADRYPALVDPSPRFLLDGLASFEHLRLAADLVLQRAVHGSERVEVLDLDFGSEPGFADGSQGHVDVAAQLAFFHVGITDAERPQDGAQLLQIRTGFVGGADLWLRDHLHERHARTIEVDQRAAWHVGELASVLLEVDSLEMDPPRRGTIADLDPAALDQRQVVLRDLVPLDEIWVGIVLAIELGGLRDLGVHCQAGEQGVLDRHAVHHRQDPGHAQTDRAHVGIGRGPGVVARAAAEHLAARGELDVALQADDDLVRALSHQQSAFSERADG